MMLQGLNELPNIAFSEISSHFEFLADFIHDCRFGCPGFKKFEYPGSDEVEVEHLALPDIQHNGAILAVRAANTFRDSVHRTTPQSIEKGQCLGAL